jgi:hypothetical protein
MQIDLIRILTEAGVLQKHTLHVLHLGGRGVSNIEDDLDVNELTPFGVKQAWLKARIRAYAFDNGMDVDDLTPEEVNELKGQITDYEMRSFGTPYEEFSAIDPNIMYEMRGADDVWLFSTKPFNLSAWKKKFPN